MSKTDVRALFVVTFFAGVLASMGLPTDLASPDDFALYSAQALLNWVKTTVFGRISQINTFTELLIHLLSLVDLALFLLLMAKVGWIVEKTMEKMSVDALSASVMVAVSLLILFIAGTLVRYLPLLPVALFLALVPVSFFERVVCDRC